MVFQRLTLLRYVEKRLPAGAKSVMVIGRYNDSKRMLAVAEKAVKELGRHIHLSFHHKGRQIQPAPSSSEEVLYLLKGRLNHTLGDKTITMSAGDAITIPPGIFHNAACTDAEDAEMIVVYSQGTRRFELEQAHEHKYRSYER